MKNIIYKRNYNKSFLKIFDKQMKIVQKDRLLRSKESSREVDYLKDIGAKLLFERLNLIKRKYPTILEFGSGAGHLIKLLDEDVKKVILLDSSDLIYRDEEIKYPFEIQRMKVDEETIEFEQNSLDNVISNLSLHWINDLLNCFKRINFGLKPDGLFLASMLGGDTLFELRTSLQLADLERSGRIMPRVSPFAKSSDITSLLNQAGFVLTTVDVEEVVINYPSIFELIMDIKNMGESNCIYKRANILNKDILISANSIYNSLHKNEDESIPATFQIINMIGWKKDKIQSQPKERGSAKESLKKVLS